MPLLADMTLPEVVHRTDLRVTLPIVSVDITPQGLERLRDDERVLLPPLFRECIDDTDVAAVCETVRTQLPCVGHPEVTEVDVRDFDVERGRRRHPVAVLASDPIEQHGQHLCLGTDQYLSAALVDALATAHAVDARPPLAWGSLRWALGIGGSISLPIELHRRLLTRYGEALVQRGYTSAIVFSTHLAPCHLATLARVVADRTTPFCQAIAPLRGLAETASDCHAGMVETALSAHLGLRVDLDRLAGPQITFSRAQIEELLQSAHTPLEFAAACAAARWNGVVGTLPAHGDHANLGELAYRGARQFRSLLAYCEARLQTIR